MYFALAYLAGLILSTTCISAHAAYRNVSVDWAGDGPHNSKGFHVMFWPGTLIVMLCVWMFQLPAYLGDKIGTALRMRAVHQLEQAAARDLRQAERQPQLGAFRSNNCPACERSYGEHTD